MVVTQVENTIFSAQNTNNDKLMQKDLKITYMPTSSICFCPHSTAPVADGFAMFLALTKACCKISVITTIYKDVCSSEPVTRQKTIV
jgi:hypothetical protein